MWYNGGMELEGLKKALEQMEEREKDHGRIEKREYRLLTDLSWLPERQEWEGLMQSVRYAPRS
jgi:hypothetical protein